MSQSPQTLKELVDHYFNRFQRSTRLWSFCFYSFIFGAAVLSAAAGVLPQIHEGAKNLATILAVSSSLFTTIAGLGRFEAKWRANRIARAGTEELKIGFFPGAERRLEDIGAELERIIREQSEEIAGVSHRERPATGPIEPASGTPSSAADSA